MDVDMTRSGEANVVKLEGSWTIERASELKGVLLEALNSGESIVVDLEGLKDLDLSFMQLFCSAHRTSLRDGKRIVLCERKSQSLKQMVRKAGFVRTLGCHKDPNKECLWIGDWKS